MAITPKEKELAAVGMSVATGCKPCTDFHVKAARKSGASDAEIKQAMSDAVAVRRRATEVMEAYGLAHLGEQRRPGPIAERVGTHNPRKGTRVHRRGVWRQLRRDPEGASGRPPRAWAFRTMTSPRS